MFEVTHLESMIYLRRNQLVALQKQKLKLRSSCLEVLCRKGIPRNFTKFTGKHLCQSLFFKETLALVFSCEFCEISRNTFFHWKLSQSQVLSKGADIFLKTSFFLRCYSHFFAIANQLPGSSITRLANVEDFFNVT